MILQEIPLFVFAFVLWQSTKSLMLSSIQVKLNTV